MNHPRWPLTGPYARATGETLTFFDFDLCGWGWRAYDVAVFR
jgi:Ser/Thr protein kinase RdoA (MazF antagonist)